MIIIGLTGSIGTGKSTVTGQFAQLGAATLNSDTVVHELLGPGGEAVEEVAALFPKAFVKGHIDRKLLGAEVFGNPKKLKALEAILHPLVRKAEERFVLEAQRRGIPVVVLDIPLLFETQGEKRCDYTVVTTAPPEIQKTRVLSRPNMTEEKFRGILAAQMPQKEKIRLADFVIRTGLGKHESLRQVKRIWLRLTGKDGSNQGI